MTTASAPLTAAQRAQASYQEMLHRQREVASARHKRELARNIRLALASAVILAGALAFGFYNGLPKLLQPAIQSANLVDPFVTSRVGRIRMPYKGDTCRQAEFDNKTGAVRSKSFVRCDSAVPEPVGASSTRSRSRLEAISDAFKR